MVQFGKMRRLRGIRTIRGRRSGLLLQSSAYVVDSIVRMTGINHFKDHVVANFELCYYGVVLILACGGLLVDADDDQAGFEALQVSK
jgi:hypothetical protein